MKEKGFYLIEGILFISIIIFNFIIKNYYLLMLAILMLGLYSIKQYGLMKDNNYLKSSVTKIVISSFLAYFITTYLIGLLLGFHKTVLSWKFSYWTNVVLVEVIIIVMEEIIRYIICKNSTKNKLPIIIYTFILATLNIILEINGYNLSDNEMVFIFLTTVVIPVVCKELLVSYLTYQISIVPSLIFKLTMSLYELILPIIPNIGNYIYATSNVILPYIIYLLVNRINHYKDKQKYQKESIRRIFYIPIITLLLFLIVLVSGAFTKTLIAIGSNSMHPSFSRGDGVIYQKTDIKKIKPGDVIAFKKDGKIITHRVIKIDKKDNIYYLKTKGDANNAPDAFEITEKDILGVIKYSIKFVGYPTLWMNDLYYGKEMS